MHRSLLALPLVASVLASAIPLTAREDKYPVTTDGLNCRSEPNTDAESVSKLDEGDEVSITCQVAGESVYGYVIWDKLTSGCYVSDYYVKTGVNGYINRCEGDGDDDPTSGTIGDLTETQTRNSWKIIQEIRDEGLGREACLAAFATALVESEIHIYANEDVAESFNYPYDLVGTDNDSVGIFQQRAMYYDVATAMDAAGSARMFLEKVVAISGWDTMDTGTLCQKVQVSAYGSKYGLRVDEAGDICDAGGF